VDSVQEAPSLGSKYRCPPKGWVVVTLALPGLAILMALLQLFNWRPFGFVLLETVYFYFVVAAFLPLCFLWIPASRQSPKDRIPWYDVSFFLLSLVIPLYYVYHITEVLAGAWEISAPLEAAIPGAILWLLVLEAGRRAAGPIFCGIIAFFSFYPVFGSYMPGILWAPNVSFLPLATFHAVGEESLMGMPMRVFARIVLGFMVFAIVLQAVGAGKFFNDMAMALVGKTRAGVAKVAIISSAFFGSISGASMANVLVTGAFTIPAMKREGLAPHLAGAVEAIASTGGILMPPVMGATAFLMAEFLGVSYREVAIAAVVPSILYYLSLFAHIDAHAARQGLKPSSIVVEVPPVWRILVGNLHIIISFIVLILLIFFLSLISQAPWIAAVLAIGFGMFRKETRLTLKRFIISVQDLGRILGELVATLAPIGLIMGSLIVAGIAFNLPYLLVRMSGGNVYFLLMLGAVAAFILGMGVPILAVYIFLAIVLAPALVQVGINAMAAHLFVLYWAMLACITPPVAVTAIVAASVAEASPMKTALYSMRLALSKYILPFIFVLSPALILQGTVTDSLTIIPSTIVGFVVISGAIEGYFWGIGRITITRRVLLLCAGLLLSWSSLGTDICGLSILVLFFISHYLLRWRKTPKSLPYT